MAQGRSAKIISMIKWIRTSRLSIKNSLPRTASAADDAAYAVHAFESPPVSVRVVHLGRSTCHAISGRGHVLSRHLSPSLFYNNGSCVRELQALVAPNPPQGVLVRGHAGRVINKLSQCMRGGETVSTSP